MDEYEPWTLEQGLLDIVRFLLKRLPWALAYWFPVALAILAWAQAGAVAGELSAFMFLMVLVSAGAGFPVGLITGRGLVGAAGFDGWIPFLAALLAAILAIVLATLAADLVVGGEADFFRVLVPACGCCGAFGGVLKTTWAEAA